MTGTRPPATRATNRPFGPFLFRAPPHAGGGIGAKPDFKARSRKVEAPDDGKALYCRACGRVITRTSDRIEVEGAHRHTFANPHGIVFEIGCFQAAPGCALMGPATDDFTWFKGFAWRVAVCGACLAHLGWRYGAAGGSHFFGLILDRLTEGG